MTAKQAFFLHALSPLHAGTGNSADVIDLPIARMKATGIPFAPGSSIKGVLREARKDGPNKANDHHDMWLATFGPDTENAADHAGALVVGDARLLALPVRSFKGTFAWVTSPLLLRLAKRDLLTFDPTASFLPMPQMAACSAVATSEDCLSNGKLYLQDLDLNATAATDPSAAVIAWAAKIAPKVFGSGNDDYFTNRFVIVDDETMTFLWETATQVDQRIRIDANTRTVAKGALWLEESLPPESLLIGLMDADRSRKSNFKQDDPREIMRFALDSETSLQFGGKATIGRGRCRIIPIPTT